MDKKIKKQIDNAELLAGKILRSLNKDREEDLLRWESNAENMELERDILDADKFEEWNNKTDAINTNKQWESFLTKMNPEDEKGKKIRLIVYRSIAGIAAVLVLALALYVGLEKFNPEIHYQTVAEADIHPGSSQAQLILNDGKVIELETSNVSEIEEGNVSMQNRKGILEYDKLTAENTVKPVVNTLKIPKGGEYQLLLPDGTKVWLNSDTELSYSIPFTENERKVNLKGEAYFDVTPDASKPFIVETERERIQVLGTEFNVSAYKEDLNVVTTLVEGKVKVNNTEDIDNLHSSFLVPNEQLSLNKETSAFTKKVVNTYNYTSWKDGRFTFNNEPLESFLKKISRWYNVEAYITDESIKDYRFTGDLPRYKNMEDILKILEAEMSVHIDIEENHIIYVTK